MLASSPRWLLWGSHVRGRHATTVLPRFFHTRLLRRRVRVDGAFLPATPPTPAIRETL
jgi:hypothetical protein